MADTLSPKERSARMAQIRSRDTSPERTVHRIVRSLGRNPSTQCKELPGTPDLVFKRMKKAIFVHGCFWHRHGSARCRLARLPKSRLDFWLPKLEENRLRDRRAERAIRRLGWRYIVIWECQLVHPERVLSRIRKFLGR